MKKYPSNSCLLDENDGELDSGTIQAVLREFQLYSVGWLVR
jgi:hypothetical protein